MQHALVTGGAGFIGSHLIDSLLKDEWRVTALDNFDTVYERRTKEENIQLHRQHANYQLVEADVRDQAALDSLTDRYDVIVHLAARTGGRRSIVEPADYPAVNVTGTQRMLELVRRLNVPQFVFASSGDVYGVNSRLPWSEDDNVLQPISPYASTKVSGELLGQVYSHLHSVRCVALRLFTVYGPRQRPDQAIHRFAQQILAGAPIAMFGDGTTGRDYTYIDDIVSGLRAAIEYTRTSYEAINLGSNQTISLQQTIDALQHALGVRAVTHRVAAPPGDVPRTRANVDKAAALLNYCPTTPFDRGIAMFAQWMSRRTSCTT